MSLRERLSVPLDPDGLDDAPEPVAPAAPKAQVAVIDDERNLGPAMQALNPRQRTFAEGLMIGLSMSEAYRAAGYKDTKAEYTARAASRLAHSDPIIAALQELTKSKLRLLAPKAITAVDEILGDKYHKDRAKVAENILGRLDPIVSKVDAHVTHEIIDHTAEAVQELRMLKQLGVAREKLLEMFGHTGLGIYERIMAEEDEKASSQAKVIDGEFTEITEGQDDDR